MAVIFTLCSNNYLAQAKVLTDSVAKYCPNTKIVIGLVDELNENIDYSFFLPAIIVPLIDLKIENTEELFLKYNIVELNTAVKASYFKYLSKIFYPCTKIVYFDPDIKVFYSLSNLFKLLNQYDILLTPHINSPILRDGYKPSENLFLNYGLYNLGFIGLNPQKEQVNHFLNWWEERILRDNRNNLAEGYFVDQLPINLVPIFYENVKILKEYGYNMAPWNLHERQIVKQDNSGIILNDQSNLLFYHFSSYNHKASHQLCKSYYTRFSFETRPDIISIYKAYHENIIENRVSFFEKIPCCLLKTEILVQPELSFFQRLQRFLSSIYHSILGLKL